jgi:hypothetical protein
MQRDGVALLHFWAITMVSEIEKIPKSKYEIALGKHYRGSDTCRTNNNINRKIISSLLSNIIKTNTTFGANVAFESSWGCAFALADPSKMDGSSLIRSLDPALSNKDMNWFLTMTFYQKVWTLNKKSS